MNALTIAGIGPGDVSCVTRAALDAIADADEIWCADRCADLAPAEKRRPLMPFGAAMDAMEKELAAGKKCCVLLSGDTGLYSMLPMLNRRFGEERLKVLPGISSVQAMCAKLHETWQDAKIISAHGRDLSATALCHYARTNTKMFVLLDGTRDPQWVHQALKEGGLDSLELMIGEKLSYDDGSVGAYEDRKYDPLSVALIVNPAPKSGLPAIGISDDAFTRGKTPMTKREIRSQVITELRLSPDSVVWDVGAGTGSVSVECALQCPLGEVFAIERDADALALIEQNKRAFHAGNIRIVPGNAPEALKELPVPTHVFLGGTGGETEKIIELIEGLGKRIRICATAVTLDSANVISRALEKYGDFTMSQIGVSRVEKVGSYRMFRAQNPVFVMSATTGGEA